MFVHAFKTYLVFILRKKGNMKITHENWQNAIVKLNGAFVN